MSFYAAYTKKKLGLEI